MPIYEYIAVDPEEACGICRRGFELRRPLDRPPLEACPLCKKPIKKLITRVNTPKILKPLSVTDAKKAGFTILERRDKGVYEKL
jgi:putative FmdB family regulatory protein